IPSSPLYLSHSHPRSRRNSAAATPTTGPTPTVAPTESNRFFHRRRLQHRRRLSLTHSDGCSTAEAPPPISHSWKLLTVHHLSPTNRRPITPSKSSFHPATLTIEILLIQLPPSTVIPAL
ncbi:hypothetical protein LINPERHAP2_LOCUS38645, partial [Linum perenne]